jgi:hypothetical protein
VTRSASPAARNARKATTLDDRNVAIDSVAYDAAVKLLGVEVRNENGVLALTDAFQRGVLHQFDRGQLTADQRDELLAHTDLIILGITLTAA